MTNLSVSSWNELNSALSGQYGSGLSSLTKEVLQDVLNTVQSLKVELENDSITATYEGSVSLKNLLQEIPGVKLLAEDLAVPITAPSFEITGLSTNNPTYKFSGDVNFGVEDGNDNFLDFLHDYLKIEKLNLEIESKSDGSSVGVTGSIETDINLFKVDSLSAKFTGAKLGVSIENGEPSFSLGGDVQLTGYDPFQTNEPPLTLSGGVTLEPESFTGSFQLKSDGAWNNPFGLPDTTLRNVAFQLGGTYAAPFVDNVGFVGDLRFGNFDLKAAFLVDSNDPDNIGLELTVNQPINLVDLWMGPVGSFALKQVGNQVSLVQDALDVIKTIVDVDVVSVDGLDADTKLDPLIKFVPVETEIGDETLKQGFAINAKLSAWGAQGTLTLEGNPYNSANPSLMGALKIPEINLGFAKLTGVGDTSLDLAIEVSPSQQLLKGDARLDIFGKTVASADVVIEETAVKIKNFSLGWNDLLSINVDNLSFNAESFSGSGSGTVRLFGQNLAGASFNLNNGNLNISSRLGYDILGYGIGVDVGITLGNENKVQLKTNFLGNNYDLNINLGSPLSDITSVYDWAEDIVANKMMGAINDAIELVSDGWNTVTAGVSAAWNEVANLFDDFATAFENIGTDIGNFVSSIFGGDLNGNDGNNEIYGNDSDNWMYGHRGNDKLVGQRGNDRLYGGPGNDELWGMDDTDYLYGESGNDWLNGNSGNDYLYGGSGNDLLEGHDQNDDLYGEEGNDKLVGGYGSDELDGGDGNDQLWGMQDTDYLHGRDGNDQLYGNSGNDYLYGEQGSDEIYGGSENDDIYGGSGHDKLHGEDGSDEIYGEDGSDQIYGDSGNDFLYGGNDSDKLQGGYGDDYLYGENGQDILDGESGNDVLYGGADNDLLYGGSGNDLLKGEDGNDELHGSHGQDTLRGDTGNDILYGQQGYDLLEGGDGDDYLYGEDNGKQGQSYQGGYDNDTLDGGYGNDFLFGGLDNDVLRGSSGNDFLDGGVGNDSLNGGVDNDTLNGGAGNDSLDGDVGNDFLDSGAGNDSLNGGAGDDVLDGGTGNDVLQGGLGNDSYVVDSAGDSIVESLNAGTDSVTSSVSWVLGNNLENLTLSGTDAINGTGNSLNNILTGNGAANTLVGNDGNDSLVGGASNDTLDGGLGNDVLDGGTGNDVLQGGAGNDSYVVDSAGDSIIEGINAGTDSVTSSVSWVLQDNLENLTLSGIGAINGTGNNLNNLINGNAAANTLNGGAGNDSLNGGDGNDVLNGGDGNDILNGGAGNDSYVVDSAGDSIIEGANAGTDLVTSSVSWSLLNNLENLTLSGTGAINGTGNSLDNVITGNTAANTLNGGAGNDTLIGNAGNDSLDGGAGNDVLDGGDGNDVLNGGLGNDSYVVDSAGDSIIEGFNAGTDLVTSSVSWVLGDNLENLTLSGSQAINGTGNSLNNVITGNAAANTLNGGLGNDTLIGGAGNDTLDGGAGNDVLDGGLGNNVLQGGAGNDSYVVDSAGNTIIESLNAGTDLVTSSVSWVLQDNLENLTLSGTSAINGTGNSLNNVINGNAAANTLNGGLGNDTLIGGAGNDTLDGGAGNDVLDGGLGNNVLQGGAGNDSYVVDSAGNTIIEGVDAGTDLVTSSVSWVLGDNLENLTLSGTSAINGTGNSLNNVINGNAAANTLDGGLGNDTLNGGAGNDSLNGGLGDDALDGGLGNDVLNGGAGNDSYVVDSANDLIIEGFNAGTDLVTSSVSWVLQDNLENLTLSGTGAINGTGNSLNNKLNGNTAANILQGGVGNDTLNGGAGNDSLDGGLGDDVLDGGLGNDVLNGGAGNDSYVVDSANDLIIEGFNSGTDLVTSSVSWVLQDNLENLTLSGTGAINGTGNSLSNIINGNAAANILTGNDGNDSLVGGAGNDSLDGGAGNDSLDGGLGNDVLNGGLGNDSYVVDSADDSIIEGFNAGTDLVTSSVSWVLQDNLENLTLSGTGAINGAGNSLNNIINGNAAANILTGNDGNDSLVGGAGNDSLDGGLGDDVLDGGLGNDTLDGGAGNDSYVIDSVGDTITEGVDAGTDLVTSSVSWVLGDNLENLTLSGTGAISGTGNSLNNVINGNAAANTLVGNDGNDTLNGGTGNDILDGGAGDDSLDGGLGTDILQGGVGNDSYIVDSANDSIIEGVDAGTDLVTSSVSWILGNNLENLILSGTGTINGTGNSLDNIINGNAAANTLNGGAGNDSLDGGLGNDILDGGAGDDVLQGGLGNDSYVVDSAGDTIIESVNAGTDLVTSSVSWVLQDNLENLTLSGSQAINGTGNSLNNVINGNAAANILTGNEGNDTLVGGAGDDVLDGGTGSDSLVGGLGNDTYVVDTLEDIITEAVNAGTDLVFSSMSWALQSNLENLTLSGTGAINGLGNSLNNSLTGNGAANILTGNDGNDILVGGAGNDSLRGGTGNDVLVGEVGDDLLIGGTGLDQLTGGVGRDSFNLTDTRTGGFDTITDFAAEDDMIFISHSEFGLSQLQGALDPSSFRLGTSATTQSDRFIYNQSTGSLFFDADGVGGTAQVQIAQLSNQAMLTSSNFAVIA